MILLDYVFSQSSGLDLAIGGRCVVSVSVLVAGRLSARSQRPDQPRRREQPVPPVLEHEVRHDAEQRDSLRHHGLKATPRRAARTRGCRCRPPCPTGGSRVATSACRPCARCIRWPWRRTGAEEDIDHVSIDRRRRLRLRLTLLEVHHKVLRWLAGLRGVTCDVLAKALEPQPPGRLEVGFGDRLLDGLAQVQRRLRVAVRMQSGAEVLVVLSAAEIVDVRIPDGGAASDGRDDVGAGRVRPWLSR